MPKLKTKRYVIYDDDHSWYAHGEYTNKYYAIKIAEELSCSMKVRVVDTEDNTVVWGK